MVEVLAACMIRKRELYEINAAAILDEENLLLLVEHPFKNGKRLLQMNDLLTEPLPVASVKDQDRFFQSLGVISMNG